MIHWSLRTLIFSNGLSMTRISTLKLRNQNRKSPTKKLKGSLSLFLLSLSNSGLSLLRLRLRISPRMRDQNNEASKRCRANMKRKHQEADEELERLKQRNVVLRAQMDQMEREVKELKSKFLSDITISKKFNF